MLPLLLAPLAAACVPSTPKKAAPGEVADVATWSFAAAVPRVSLWPRAEGTPERKKRKLDTRVTQGRLEARVAGPDPGFEWRFATPVEARVFRVEVVADSPGTLQLFWSTSECPTFREACSASHAVDRGDNLATFMLDPSRPIRELRLDLPEGQGKTLWFSSIGFSPDPDLDTPWVGRDTSTVSLHEGALELVATEADPWLVVMTPGLQAASTGKIEVIVRGPPGPVQLFWDGPCGGFSERCSTLLAPADAGGATHEASLDSPEWRGPIGALRLDPGPDPGTYRIDSVTLRGRMQGGAAPK